MKGIIDVLLMGTSETKATKLLGKGRALKAIRVLTPNSNTPVLQ